MSAEGFRGLVEAITARPVESWPPRCDDCCRPALALAITPAGRYCADCMKYTPVVRPVEPRREGYRP